MLKTISLTIIAVAGAALRSASAQGGGAAAAPNDAQIAMIAVVADTVDINAGKMAAEKTENKAVKAFAETMVRDHGAVNSKAIALAKKLGVTPEESATSSSLKSGGDKEMATLNELSGAAFDKEYVDHEVSYHEAVAGVLDNTLIPNTRNAELKALLESARPIFVSHLEHAKMLQQSLNK